jgi:cyclophilin family peptidyl-prolyl cis-trans isomerase
MIACCALAIALGGCGDDGDAGSAGQGGGARQGEGESTGAGTQPQSTVGSSGCKQVAEPKEKPDGGEEKPRTRLEAGKAYRVAMATSCGEFTITVDQRASPRAAASFVALARRGFFDGTIFHRIVPEFVIQGGDPTGTGSGGPGYKTRDKVAQDAAYTTGVVAMAKTGAERPGTAGSQFFVVTGDEAPLPPEYAVLGKVTAGLEVVERIGMLGTASEQPSQVVLIEDVRVEAS